MSYTNWYRTGTIGVTKNSKAVTGSGTYWGAAGLNPGDIVKINGVDYELDSVTDNTHLTLKTAYTGDTASGLQYSIVRNFTANTNAKIASIAAGLLYSVERFLDEEHKTILGKNAYEVACDNGYVGTVSQWLEDLKAAGEWTKADSRLTTLESDNTSNKTRLTSLETLTDDYDLITQEIKHIHVINPDTGRAQYRKAVTSFHNSIVRGACIGTKPTAAQLEQIRYGNYKDMYLMDYWETDMEIEYPILNGADSSNGDTFTNEEYPRKFVGKVQWFIADLSGYACCNAVGGGYNGALIIMPRVEQAGSSYLINGKNEKIHPIYWRNIGIYPMNYKNSNECGYYYSLLHQKALPAVYAALKEAWGFNDSYFGKMERVQISTSRTGSANSLSSYYWQICWSQRHGAPIYWTPQNYANWYPYVEQMPQFAVYRNHPHCADVDRCTPWFMDIVQGETDKFAMGQMATHMLHNKDYRGAASSEGAILPYFNLKYPG